MERALIEEYEQTMLSVLDELSPDNHATAIALADLPLTAVKALPVPTDATMSSIGAFRLIALSCLNHLQNNEAGVCRSDEPEFVHKARVAIRRLRSAIRLWQPRLPEDFVTRFDPLWQELANKLGDTRNWDVFLAETLPALADALPGRVEVERLSSHARRRCANSRKASRSALKSAVYSRLLIDFSAAIQSLPDDAAGSLARFVPRCLDKRARRVEDRAAAALGTDDAARHRLRVAFKQLRYAVEFFTPILAGPVLANYHQSASDLQDLLGRLNDLAVASQLVAEAPTAGQGQGIADWLAAQTDSLLPEFARRLNDFQQQPVPWKAG